ncbi:MAG: ribonuclease P protein component [Candidatus Niyogibacteria bacterium]|nr:MAG: ribonuclease P protein component [Candidatus Niyogibacteria bacterium]
MAAFKRSRRLYDKKAISQVLRRGRRIERGGLVVYFQSSDNSASRLAVVVSKSVDKRAVRRNKIRRQISEIMRGLIFGIKKPLRIIVRVLPEASKADFGRLKNALEEIFVNINNLKI